MNFENDEGIRDLFKIFKKLKKGCTLKNINVIKCACPLLEACKVWGRKKVKNLKDHFDINFYPGIYFLCLRNCKFSQLSKKVLCINVALLCEIPG